MKREVIKVVSSESVTEGHPDKVCDQISDAILDAYLKEDKDARVACETVVKDNTVILLGEITSTAKVSKEDIVCNVLKKIGYDNEEVWGTDYKTVKVIDMIGKQSPDIAQGVDKSVGLMKEIGAGDQGMMYGFACNETDCLMPLPIVLAHRLTHRLAGVRKSGLLNYLGPDGKALVTVEYCNDGTKRVSDVVVSAHHRNICLNDNDTIKILKKDILEYVIKPELKGYLTENTNIYINPTGKFMIGGPKGDTGLTGRKIIVDTYGGYAKHGGGAFSGKDPTKVDRSGAYLARYLAKNIVSNGLADKCEVQLAYCIGKSNTIGFNIDTFGTEKVPIKEIIEWVSVCNPSPMAIIENLNLKKVNYQSTAAYGHFGEFQADKPWERCDNFECFDYSEYM